VEFAMSGDFWVNVTIDTGDDESVVNMLVRAKR
jgi:hypothetical protein